MSNLSKTGMGKALQCLCNDPSLFTVKAIDGIWLTISRNVSGVSEPYKKDCLNCTKVGGLIFCLAMLFFVANYRSVPKTTENTDPKPHQAEIIDASNKPMIACMRDAVMRRWYDWKSRR